MPTSINSEHDHEPTRRQQVARFAAGFVMITGLAMAAGMASAALKKHWTMELAIAALVMLAIAGLAGMVFRRLQRITDGGVVGTREKRARSMFSTSLVIGGGLGLLLAAGSIQIDDPLYLYSDKPIPAAIAALALAVWLVLVPLVSWRWWRNIDEHEVRAYSFGGMTALYAYFFITPAWWVAFRGGFVPEPQHMAIFLAVSVLWSIAWMWRRHR